VVVTIEALVTAGLRDQKI